MSRLPVVAVERVAMRFAPRPWPFAVERRAEIDACFAQLQREQPALWNGRVLMMYEHTLTAQRVARLVSRNRFREPPGVARLRFSRIGRSRSAFR